VVLTDGLDQGSQVAPEQAVRRCQELKVPLHTIGIGTADWAHLQVKSLVVPEALFTEDTVSAQLNWRAQGSSLVR